MFAHAARAAGRVAGGALAVYAYRPVRAAASACATVPWAAGCAIWGASGVARQCAASSGDRLTNSPRAVTETRRRQTPPTHPQPSPADQHAALACAGWPVRPQSKMPGASCGRCNFCLPQCKAVRPPPSLVVGVGVVVVVVGPCCCLAPCRAVCGALVQGVVVCVAQWPPRVCECCGARCRHFRQQVVNALSIDLVQELSYI